MKKLLFFLFCLTFLNVAKAHEPENTLDRIKRTGTISIGYQKSSLPFSYTLNNNKTPIGYSIDICKILVQGLEKNLGRTIPVNYVATDNNNRVPYLESGKTDLDCSTTSNIIDRQQNVLFSYSYYFSSIKALVHNSSNIFNIDQLKNRRIALVIGSTAVPTAHQYDQQHHMNFKYVMSNSISDAFNSLELGQADAIIYDDVLLSALIANNSQQEEFKFMNFSLKSEPMAITMSKSAPNLKLLSDTILNDAFKNGDMEELYSKWFLSPIPPNKINLKLPMSDELRNLFDFPNDKGVN